MVTGSGVSGSCLDLVHVSPRESRAGMFLEHYRAPWWKDGDNVSAIVVLYSCNCPLFKLFHIFIPYYHFFVSVSKFSIFAICVAANKTYLSSHIETFSIFIFCTRSLMIYVTNSYPAFPWMTRVRHTFTVWNSHLKNCKCHILDHRKCNQLQSQT